jgi:quercetin dioxygenase-like cupin family protein
VRAERRVDVLGRQFRLLQDTKRDDHGEQSRHASIVDQLAADWVVEHIIRRIREETMTARLATLPFALALVLAFTVLRHMPAAQEPSPSLTSRYASGWENDRLRVRSISVAPGAQVPAYGDSGAVFVFFTADLGGRMPASEATWQPAGGGSLENRGKGRVDALVIELKNAEAQAAGMTPPEALPATREMDARVLIDNPRVLVTRQRYLPGVNTNPGWHFHPQDTLVVYLTGGHVGQPLGGWGLQRVHRGDIDVVPANMFHGFANPGIDPLEFLAIFPK